MHIPTNQLNETKKIQIDRKSSLLVPISEKFFQMTNITRDTNDLQTGVKQVYRDH